MMKNVVRCFKVYFSDSMVNVIDVLQVRTYKKQIEEAEEIAAMNLAKFRKTQVDMQESLERADISEQALAKFRARGRSMSAAPRDVEIPIHRM